MVRLRILALAWVGISSAAGAQAQRALLDCTAILSDGERLACYDAAVKAFSTEARAVSERREAQAAKLAAAAATAGAAQKADGFGRETTRAAKADPARIERIDSVVREILSDGRGKPVFVLENGQIWRQAEAINLPTIRASSPVSVRRGAMGSYRLFVEGGNRSVQVVRVR
ncbi:hypothetical protein L6Q21_04910 [Sandaracinobacter sp. RS1-74]|uniref:hypothetical protein n=1 Tax=Sandaracinobacteroides sayramensis TaxID=2913411 RepID=UPI001EDA7992|nr:hypothetical protein [Sandaracinobacteroides sayramensis]MCG2840321.1 hypothetical protein [Sandaracinobacteroides sayramensis]